MNGTNEFQGRVEVLLNGGWRSVCHSWNYDIYTRKAFFNDTAATVICRQLRKSSGKAEPPNSFGLPPIIQHPPILGLNEPCTGRESSMLECPWKIEDVECNDYAAVTCS